MSLKFMSFMVIAAVSACGTKDAPKDAHHAHHHRFDDAAKWSKVFDDPARDEWQKPSDVVTAMKIVPGMTVADVGAGTGYFEPHLSRATGTGGRVIAIDVEPDMVRWVDDRAKKEGLVNVSSVQGAPDDPKLAPASVDRVLVVDTWHHIDDRRSYAAKLAAALKPGGAVYLVDFTKESPHGPPKDARLGPDDVSADFAAAGLHVRRIDVALPYQWMIAAERSP